MPDTPKSEVGNRFARAARRYDQFARHQAIAAQHLADRLPTDVAPRHILDLGCGTGLLTRHLVTRFPDATLTVVDLAPAMLESCRARCLRARDRTVASDAESYWPAEPVDAVVSSCAVQWFHDPERWIDATHARLAPGGWLASAFPIAGTLREFAACAPRGTPLLPMPSAATWRLRFARAPWRSLDTSEETVTLWYPSALDILRALHGIGATCAAPGAAALGPNAIRRLASDYEDRFRTPEGVPCTYELMYVLARRLP
jgi:malonyl-ACP O-methyltransferase BioC